MDIDVDQVDVDRVIAALELGQAVIIPTDTVYGIAADPRNRTAMAQLFDLKQRPEGVPIAVLIASLDQARSLIDWTDELEALASQHWPGALTLVGRAIVGGLHLGSIDTIGVRVPDHPLVRACAERFGPIATTSANRHGEPTIIDPDELTAVFGGNVGVIIDGGVLDGTASTVIDTTVSPINVLRQGAVNVGQDDGTGPTPPSTASR